MIKSLRKKFILVAMLSTLVVLTAVMGTVNVMNYVRMAEKADGMTELLAQNDGKFPGDFSGEESSDTGIPDEQNPAGNKPEDPPGGMKVEDLSPETPYETRFFSVTMNEESHMISVDTENIAAVTEDEAEEYALNASVKGRTTGFEGIYRYRAVITDNGFRYIFLDCRREITNFKNLLLVSVSVSGLGLGAVLLLVMFFSRLVFKPVAESLAKQKRFITDASHELKTPLTIIDANTEVMEMENGESQWTRSTRKQIQRLSALTQQLVTLSRLDEERDVEEKTVFSLSDAAAESIQPFEALMKAQGKHLELLLEEGISYTGNEKSIRQLIGILMDNAVKYSSENGRIWVKLERRGRKIHLEIYNDSDELPQGKLDFLFERFYRLDNSRNSETGGSGIGLSVAKAIVQAHKGRISAHSENGTGLNITVIF